jgi:hypothetical protein
MTSSSLFGGSFTPSRDTVELILPYLDGAQLIALQHVSRSWHALLCRSAVWDVVVQRECYAAHGLDRHQVRRLYDAPTVDPLPLAAPPPVLLSSLPTSLCLTTPLCLGPTCPERVSLTSSPPTANAVPEVRADMRTAYVQHRGAMHMEMMWEQQCLVHDRSKEWHAQTFWFDGRLFVWTSEALLYEWWSSRRMWQSPPDMFADTRPLAGARTGSKGDDEAAEDEAGWHHIRLLQTDFRVAPCKTFYSATRNTDDRVHAYFWRAPAGRWWLRPSRVSNGSIELVDRNDRGEVVSAHVVLDHASSDNVRCVAVGDSLWITNTANDASGIMFDCASKTIERHAPSWFYRSTAINVAFGLGCDIVARLYGGERTGAKWIRLDATQARLRSPGAWREIEVIDNSVSRQNVSGTETNQAVHVGDRVLIVSTSHTPQYHPVYEQPYSIQHLAGKDIFLCASVTVAHPTLFV